MIAWFATKGSGTNEALRMESLLSRFPDKEEWTFDKRSKVRSFIHLLRQLMRKRPDLLVMEGTGVAGGLLCLLGRWLWGVPYVFSSGDAVGPFVAAHAPWAGPAFHLYERLLCRGASGFIGWTPYLCGRALTFGCRRAVTAPGWPVGGLATSPGTSDRLRYRQAWGIPDGTLVVGLVGAIEWNAHHGYAYGLELVRAVDRLQRQDMVVVIVGGGSGIDHLRKEAGPLLGTRVLLPGPVPLEEVLPCLSAFDVASLPQSTDAVGAFRYTTKLSEYASARLPVVTSQIPVAYDLGADWMWRLPGAGPWDEVYLGALATLLDGMDPAALQEKRHAIPDTSNTFDQASQVTRVTAFIGDIRDTFAERRRPQAASESS